MNDLTKTCFDIFDAFEMRDIAESDSNAMVLNNPNLINELTKEFNFESQKDFLLAIIEICKNNYQHRINALIDKYVRLIKNWDKSNIYDLLDYLTKFNEICEKNECKIDEYIKMDALPTSNKHNIDDLSDYPTWACDDSGFCLVGDAADNIEHIDSIREF